MIMKNKSLSFTLSIIIGSTLVFSSSFKDNLIPPLIEFVSIALIVIGVLYSGVVEYFNTFETRLSTYKLKMELKNKLVAKQILDIDLEVIKLNNDILNLSEIYKYNENHDTRDNDDTSPFNDNNPF